MAVYKRTYKDETVIVAINNTTNVQTVTVEIKDLPKNKQLKGQLHEGSVKERNGEYTFVVEAEQAEIYAITNKTGLSRSTYLTIGIGIIGLGFLLTIILRKMKRKKVE